MYLYSLRSSHRSCTVKKLVLKDFASFNGKHLQVFRPATLLKRDGNTGVFVKFAKDLKTPILKNIQELLLL